MNALSVGPIAYLTGEYPKVSHTFILREIAALRAQGMEVHACTVRRPHPKYVVGPDQKAEAKQTFCILEAAKWPHRMLGAHAKMLLRWPGRWASALGLAWRTRPPGLKGLLWQIFYFLEAAVLSEYLLRLDVVHLHNHFANSSCSVAMLTSEMSGIPFSFTLHGPAIFYEPRKWRIDEKIARARFVACISHFCRSQAMYFSNPAHWGKLRIVHCGVTPGIYGRRSRKAFGQNILFIGRLDAIKGVPLLLEAFSDAHKTYPEAKLTLIGDGPVRGALEARAVDLRLGESVDFLGYQSQEEVASRLEESDILVLPSFAEGVPLVLMEAMASRIPVIASAVAGVPELVEDGISGCLVPAGDLVTLTDRLKRLLADPSLCRCMGSAGRTKIEADFDVSREAAWLKHIFLGTDDGRLRPDHGAFSPE